GAADPERRLEKGSSRSRDQEIALRSDRTWQREREGRVIARAVRAGISEPQKRPTFPAIARPRWGELQAKPGGRDVARDVRSGDRGYVMGDISSDAKERKQCHVGVGGNHRTEGGI